MTATALAGGEPERPTSPLWMWPSATTTATTTAWTLNAGAPGDYWWRLNTASHPAGRSGAVWTFPGGYS